MDKKSEQAILEQIEEKCADAEYGPHSGTETLLTVDDEDYVLNLETEVLRACGYTVLEALGGEQALKVAAEHADEIQLLITDVRMPSMDGIELGEKISAVCPDLKILFISGFAENTPLAGKIADGQVAFLAKPFTPLALVQKVRQILEGYS